VRLFGDLRNALRILSAEARAVILAERELSAGEPRRNADRRHACHATTSLETVSLACLSSQMPPVAWRGGFW
jgi:hypothetical protein